MWTINTVQLSLTAAIYINTCMPFTFGEGRPVGLYRNNMQCQWPIQVWVQHLQGCAVRHLVACNVQSSAGYV